MKRGFTTRSAYKLANVDKVRLIQRCLDLFEEARVKKNAVSVSELARRFPSGKGYGAERGREVHRAIWGFDPFEALQHEYFATPMPLAYRFRSFYLYGVADQVVFYKGVPHRVLEYKSYSKLRKAELIQASLYGLLLELLFAAKPKVYVKTPGKTLEIKDWELLALMALARL